MWFYLKCYVGMVVGLFLVSTVLYLIGRRLP